MTRKNKMGGDGSFDLGIAAGSVIALFLLLRWWGQDQGPAGGPMPSVAQPEPLHTHLSAPPERSYVKGIGWFISNVHPLIYLVIYILLVPIFAAGYCGWSNEFFAPYARFEPAADSDRQALGALIDKAIRTSLRYRSPNDAILVQGWSFDPDSIRVTVAGADSEHASTIAFRVYAGLEKETPKGKTITNVELPVSFSGERGRVVRGGGYNRSYPNNVRPTLGHFTRGPAERVALEEELYQKIFKSYGESVVLDEAIVFSELASRQIDDFVSGVNGNAGAVSGSIWRMLYFSSVVITTLGFGDILPLSPLARGLVAAEALLGIVVAGFFLNAIAHRAARPSER